jgi:hypothetical protein
MNTRYGISSVEYLKRAELRLKEQDPASWFYAAFELRCGIEARMEEYLDAWDHIGKKQKAGWQVTQLGRNVEQAFRIGNNIVRWAVYSDAPPELVIVFYHTPVSKSLQKCGERLGNYMHSMKKFRAPDDAWWESFQADLRNTADQLRIANTGTLLGPPLQKKGSKKVDMKLQLPPDSNVAETLKSLMHRPFHVHVEYLDKLPEPLEPQAAAWTDFG